MSSLPEPSRVTSTSETTVDHMLRVTWFVRDTLFLFEKQKRSHEVIQATSLGHSQFGNIVIHNVPMNNNRTASWTDETSRIAPGTTTKNGRSHHASHPSLRARCAQTSNQGCEVLKFKSSCSRKA